MLALFMGSGPALAQSAFERQVLDALNVARSDPQAYARGLQQYRAYFHANILRYPGQSADIVTEEGVRVVDEAIGFLGHQPALGRIAEAGPLERSAATHVADQSANGGEGHQGSDGSSPGTRMERLGGGAYVAEVIAYGSIDPQDVVRQLIVDDGVQDRGHRSILYSADLRFAGVSCGPHPQYRMMCVIDLGITPDGHYPTAGIRTASR